MRIVFFGTPDFAVPPLRFLLSTHQVIAVVTQPDSQKGRGKKLLPPPVKEEALRNNVPVLQPNRVRDKDFIEALAVMDADLFVVAAYGQKLPVSLLEMPKLACINIHASLLPAYRGAAPIQWAIINGENKTGITIMHMEKGIDTGDMILKKELLIEPEDNYGTLHDKMALLGAAALEEAIAQIEKGIATAEKQDHSRSTYAHMITKETGHINWHSDARCIHNLVRGLTPVPGAYTFYNGEILRVCRGEAIFEHKVGVPGEIVEINKNCIVVQTSSGCYAITELQAPGGKKMKTADYLRGHTLSTGITLN